MLLEIVIGFLALMALWYWSFSRKYKFWTEQGIFQIKPIFPVGSFPEFFTQSRQINETCLEHAKMTAGLPFYGIYFIGSPILIIRDVNLIKNLLVKDFDVFVDRDKSFVEKMRKTNTLTDKIWLEQMSSALGENWKNIRSTFTPIFTSGKMKAMMVFIQETCNRLTTAVEKIAESGEDFELKELLGKYSMDTIASCAFGVDSQAFTNKDSKFVQFANKIFKQSFTDGIKLIALFIPFDIGVYLFRLTNTSINKQNETEFFHDIVLESLRQRKKSGVRRNDLIDLMVDAIRGEINEEQDADETQFEKDAKLNHKSKKEFDELTIVATAIVILVAGYDTTGTTLAWACYELAKNPEYQDKLRAEVDDVMGDSNRDLTYDDLQSMTYVDQIISETLRLHTPVAVLQRATEREYKIPGHDIVLKKEQAVWVNTMAIHFDPEFYPNPESFNPENFSKEAKANRTPYAFLPFGQGPRGCLGMRFALLEAKLALANLVKKFTLLPSEKTKEPPLLDPQGGIAYAKEGLYMKVEKRN